MATLLEAAAQMFSREGLSTTTNRIAERAGLSVGTLYQYFPNKQALLRALARRHVGEVTVVLEVVFAELRATEPGFEESVRAIIEAVVEVHRDRPGLHALLHRVVTPLVPVEVEEMRVLENRLVTEVAFHLDRCGRGEPEVDHTARTVVHLVDAHLHRVSMVHRLDVEELVALVDRLTR
ncbi:TetR/AcrR family transcriptional regulator [Nocardia shimofusensis]|uniref:TetR/AcrR family transcriptional regulator n=1 Tax=Nocardia shimofusensis TaxID=228596 RepID=UPI000B2D35D4|nr:TetR/AcrR family transcriptional regulator [Nocardia shimofusensis]